MITDHEVAHDVLPDVFAAQAAGSADPQEVLAAVQARIGRRRVSTRRTVVIGAAVGAVITAMAGTSAIEALRHPGGTTSAPALSAGRSTHPGLDQLSSSCLDVSAVVESWGGDLESGYGGIGQDNNGKACSHEMDAILRTHPVAISAVAAGGRTVYLGAAPNGVLTGFFSLTPAESAAAAHSTGQKESATDAYYLVVSIPDDNPRAVLLSILRQYRLPSEPLG